VKKATTLILILLNQIVFAEDYLDKEFYLIDSIDVSDFSEPDKAVTDSVLAIFHEIDAPSEKAGLLDRLIETLEDESLQLRYNWVKLEYSYFRMFSKKLSKQEEEDFKRYYGRGINLLGLEEVNQGNLLKSLDYFFKSLEILKDVGEQKDFVSIYSNIGRTYFHQGSIDQAETYLKKAYELVFDIEDYELQALSINNLAVICQERNDLESSLKYHFESLNLSLEKDNLYGAGMSYNNIGGIYVSSYPDSLEQGMDYLLRALDIFKHKGDYSWISMTYDKLVRSYLKKQDFQQAEVNANFCLLYALKSGATQPILRAYRSLYKVKRAINKPSEALNYYEKFVDFRDSLYNSSEKVASAKKELEFQYKSDKELAQKENEKRLALTESENKRQKIFNFWITAFVIVILIFAFIQTRKIRQIKSQKEIIEAQNDERKILLKEIHHRVKNNFQIVCSVLRLQSFDEDNPVVDKAFEDAINRIQSMAEVHELIYKEESFADINPQTYFERLTNSITHFSYEKKIDYIIESKIESLKMEMMIALGIATNELITNSIKHAFNEATLNPEIKITLDTDGDEIFFVYRDNGEGFDSVSHAKSFGTELIETVIDQVEGKVSYNANNKGIFATIRFKTT